MAKQGMSVDEAVRLVQSKRPEADPNSNFLEQLHAFHDSPVRCHALEPPPVTVPRLLT
jgi:hypothetical protein